MKQALLKLDAAIEAAEDLKDPQDRKTMLAFLHDIKQDLTGNSPMSDEDIRSREEWNQMGHS